MTKKDLHSRVLFLIIFLCLFLIVILVDYIITDKKMEGQNIALGDQVNRNTQNIVPFYEVVPNNVQPSNIYNTVPNIYQPSQMELTQSPINLLENRALEAPIENPQANLQAPNQAQANRQAQQAQPRNDILNAICNIFPFLLICQPQQVPVVQPVQQIPLLQPQPQPLVIVPPLPVAPAQANPIRPCNIIKKYCLGDILEWDYYRLNNDQPPVEELCQTPRVVGNCNADRSGRRTCGVVTTNGVSTPKCVER